MVVGKAPDLLSKVAYRPWNGAVPPIKRDGLEEEAEVAHVLGLVTRRVVDISAKGGFVSTLDLTTNFLGVNKPLADQDIMNFYSENRNVIIENENIDPFPPGAFLLTMKTAVLLTKERYIEAMRSAEPKTALSTTAG